MSVIERFWTKIKKTKTCWLWTAAKTSNGYGVLQIGTRESPKLEYAHRFAMQLAGFPLDGNEGHHQCPNKNCVRIHADHVQVVPRQKNPDSIPFLNSQKTHCIRGHAFAGKNLGRTGKHRFCRTCANQKKRERRKEMTEDQRKRERQYQRDYLKTNPKQYQKLLRQQYKAKRWLLPHVRKRHTERARERRELTSRQSA